MKVLYFDCSSGISGNMTLGALSELIDDPHYLVNELKKLNVDGYHIHISKEKKNGITGTYVDVHLEHEHHHDHKHEHVHHHHHESLWPWKQGYVFLSFFFSPSNSFHNHSWIRCVEVIRLCEICVYVMMSWVDCLTFITSLNILD